MYHNLNGNITPRQNTWERQVPAEYSRKEFSPFTEGIRSTVKQPNDNSKTPRKELLQRMLQDKFKSIYESPGKRSVEATHTKNESQIMREQGVKDKGTRKMSIERAQSDAGTPLYQIQFDTYSTRSKRMRDMIRRNDEVKSTRKIETQSQYRHKAKAPEIRIEDNIDKKNKELPVDSNKMKDNLAGTIGNKPQVPKSYSENNLKLNLKNEKAPRYKDIEEKLEVHSATNKIETNKANKADSVRSQPVERKLSNLSRVYSECSKCSGCCKNGLEYVCISCINEEIAKQKAMQRQKERQSNLVNDHNKQLQRIKDLQKKYMEETAALKRAMNEEMKASLEQAVQRKKRLREEG